jgi:uncharacterized protein YaaR (DUF327 family)
MQKRLRKILKEFKLYLKSKETNNKEKRRISILLQAIQSSGNDLAKTTRSHSIHRWSFTVPTNGVVSRI